MNEDYAKERGGAYKLMQTDMDKTVSSDQKPYNNHSMFLYMQAFTPAMRELLGFVNTPKVLTRPW